MAQKKFNSVEGFSVGIPGNVIDVIDNVANVYANRVFVQQYANLGDVGNIYIGGGTSGQVLKTDGSGNLTWALDTAPAGGNTTEVQFNNGGSLDGSSAFSFNKISNALSITGNITSENANLGNLVTANYLIGTLVTQSQPNITSVGTLTSLTASGNVTGSYIIGNGSTLSSITGSNVTGQVGNALVAGTVYTNAQPNITSLGTLVSANISGNITSGNALLGNLVTANYFDGTLVTQSQPNITSVGTLLDLNVLGNVTSAYFVGNGASLTQINGSNVSGQVGNALVASTVYSNAQPNITSVGTLIDLDVTGNVSANYFIGNGSSLTSITGGNVNGQVSNALIAGTVYSNAQPNITSVGSLVDLDVTGNTTSAYFIGDGSQLTNIDGSQVSNVANANYANFAGTVITASQPNITSIGTLVDANVSGNVLIGGNLNVNGTTFYTNVDTLSVEDPIIEQGNGPNNAPLTTNDGKDRGSLLHYYTTAPVDAFMGWDNSNGEFAFGSNVSVTGEIVTFNSLGNVRADTFIGSLTGAATTAGTVTTNAQPNITSVGTLTSLNVNGNTTSAYFIGNGSQLTGVIGNANYAAYAGNVINATQSNITTVGSLSSLTVTGLITATAGGIKVGNLQDTTGTNTIQLTNSDIIVTGNISAGGGGTGNVTATYFIGNGSQLTGVIGSANYAAYAGNVTNASQPNITSVGTLSNLAVTGTFTKDNKNVPTYTSSTTTPTDPTVGDQWYDQTNDITYQYIYDGASYYWVDISSGYIDSNVNAVASTLVLRDANANIYGNYLVGSGLSIDGTANLGSISNVKITGGSDGYVIQTDGTGNLTFVSAGSTGIAGSNTQVQFNDGGSFGASSDFTFDKTSNSLSVSGNITSAYFIGNGSQLTGLPASYANSNVASYLPTYTGNFTAGNISATGNITSAYFIGNGSTLSSITGSNVSGQVSNALVAGTVYTNAQPNITSVGTLTSLVVTTTANVGTLNATDGSFSGNVVVTGNLTVQGNTNYINVDSLTVEDPIIEQGGGPNNAPLTTNDGKDRGSLLHYYTTAPVDAFMGWDNSNGEFAFGSNVSLLNEVVTFNSLGNVRANYFLGNAASLTGINASNISSGTIGSSILGNSTVYIGTTGIALNRSSGSQTLTGVSIDGSASSATTAGTVTTNAQPNITSVGTLTSLSVTANVGAGNVLTNNLLYANGVAWDLSGTYSNSNVASYLPTYTGNVSANYFIGNGATITNITGSNVVGQVSNALIAGTVFSNAQPNITSVGILTALDVTSNVSAGNIKTDNILYANGTPWVFSNYSNTNVAAYLPTYTGNVSASYFIGNGSALTNINGSNVDGQVSNALIAGTVFTNAQPNITSIGTLTSLDVSGNANVNGILYANTIVGPSSANVTITAGAFVSEFDDTGNITLSDNVSVVNNLSAANILTDHLLYANGVAWDLGGTYANSNVANYLPTYTGEFAAGNINVTGNITASYLIGNGSQLTGLPAGYANSNVAAYLPTYTGNVSANYFIGNGATLTFVTGANVDGQVSNALVAGTVYTNAQPNITSVGTLTTLDVTSNVSAGNIKSDNLLYANGAPYVFTTSAAGSNTQIQFNDNTAFAGNANLTFNKTTNTVTTDNIDLNGNLTVNGLTDLGSVSNITITGGTSGYVLTTDGSGGLSWGAAGSGAAGLVSISKDRFLTDGSGNTYSLSTTPASKNLIEVVIDGLQQISNTYSLTGSTLSFPTNPAAGQIIEVTSFGAVDLTGNAGEVQYNAGGSFGSSNTFTFNSGTNTLSVSHLVASGNLTSQAGYLYVNNGIIAVDSGNAGIFNTGVANINLGLAANVTIGSTTGNTTIRGNLLANNASITNLSVSDYYSSRDSVTVTTDSIIDQFPVNTYRSAKYTMRVNSDDGYQAVEVLLVHNGSSSYVTIYGSISSSGSDIVTLSSNIGSGNVRLFASTASTNTNVKILGTYVPD